MEFGVEVRSVGEIRFDYNYQGLSWNYLFLVVSLLNSIAKRVEGQNSFVSCHVFVKCSYGDVLVCCLQKPSHSLIWLGMKFLPPNFQGCGSSKLQREI